MKNNKENKKFQENNLERVIWINGEEFTEADVALFGWRACELVANATK